MKLAARRDFRLLAAADSCFFAGDEEDLCFIFG